MDKGCTKNPKHAEAMRPGMFKQSEVGEIDVTDFTSARFLKRIF